MVCPSKLSEEVKHTLISNGWSHRAGASEMVSRVIESLEGEFTAFPHARQALECYLGLRVQQDGAGEEIARESFCIDPTLALGEYDRFKEHSNELRVQLYPLGEAGSGHVFLAISSAGTVYALMEDVWIVGNDIDEAIENLVRGRRLRRQSGLPPEETTSFE